jgi:hypothetical protein
VSIVHSDHINELVAALAKARKTIKVIGRSGKNAFHKYNYVQIQDIIRESAADLAEQGIHVLASIAETKEHSDVATKQQGVQKVVSVRAVTRAVHSSGQWVEITTWGGGADGSIEKAVLKATTSARKYGQLLMLNMASDDEPDPDADESRDETLSSLKIENGTVLLVERIHQRLREFGLSVDDLRARMLEDGADPHAVGGMVGDWPAAISDRVKTVLAEFRQLHEAKAAPVQTTPPKTAGRTVRKPERVVEQVPEDAN